MDGTTANKEATSQPTNDDHIQVGNIQQAQAVAIGRGATAVYQGLTVAEVATLVVELKNKDQPIGVERPYPLPRPECVPGSRRPLLFWPRKSGGGTAPAGAGSQLHHHCRAVRQRQIVSGEGWVVSCVAAGNRD
jgi:hypothetical protein